jgi:hypothetical protein
MQFNQDNLERVHQSLTTISPGNPHGESLKLSSIELRVQEPVGWLVKVS